MEEVTNKIKETEVKIAAAERIGDVTRINTLESLFVELHRSKNFLLQQQIATGMRPFRIMVLLIETFSNA
jgi:hypothetical protein